MQVHCPQCGSLILADDVNLQTLAARCRQCNNIFSIAERIRAEAGSSHVPPIDTGAPIPQPARFHIEELGNSWQVSWRWFTPGVIFLIIFCCVWDPVVIVSSTLGYRADPTWLTLLFPIPFVAAGIAMTYLALASAFNKTIVRIDGSDLAVHLGPIPWRGSQTLNTADIRQIFFKPTVTVNRRQSTTWYTVFVVDRDAKSTRLISGLTDITEATFLQRRLERRLHINPSPAWPAT